MLFRSRRQDLDELQRLDGPRLAVNLQDEVARFQVADRPAAFVGGDQVDRDELGRRAELRLAVGTRRRHETGGEHETGEELVCQSSHGFCNDRRGSHHCNPFAERELPGVAGGTRLANTSRVTRVSRASAGYSAIELLVVLTLAGTAWVRITNLALLFAMLALGLNIVVGFAGLLDLGYIAFYAVGAYIWALLASPHFGLH